MADTSRACARNADNATNNNSYNYSNNIDNR